VRPSSTADRGFVLVTTLLVMTLLTVLLTAAFVMISAESRTTGSAYETSRALNLAQAGLQGYFATAHNLASGRDSTDYTFPGGYARIVAQRLRDSTAAIRPLWVVYSTGVDTTRSLTTAGGAQRVVAQLAYHDRGTLPSRAAMVAANDVNMTANGTNPISGVNLGFTITGCTIPAADDTTGLTTPSGAYGGTGGADVGNGIEYLANPTAVMDSTHIDWARLLGGEFTPDYVGTFPAAGNSTYQTHYFTADVTIPSGQRRGVLVTTGDVTLVSGSHWDGIIVAGGRLDGNVNSNYALHGMVITGLNISQGENVQANQVRRGTGRTIKWDWCYARSAINSLGFLTPIRGTYTDTWDTY